MLVDLTLIISNKGFRRLVDPETEVKEEGEGLDLTIFKRSGAAHTVHFYSFDIFRGDQVVIICLKGKKESPRQVA